MLKGEVFQTEAGKKRPDLYRLYNLTLKNKGIEFSDQLAESYETGLRAYFEAVLSDLHPELSSVWANLVEAYQSGKISKDDFERLANMLGTPVTWNENGVNQTFTQDYAISIEDKLRSDPNFQAEMMRKWKDAARKQYNMVQEELNRLTGG